MQPNLAWQRYVQYWILGLVATALVLGFCLLVDSSNPGHLAFNIPTHRLASYRLVRVGSAALVGAALAASGVLLQALLRNPLADPYVLGISTGSSVGVLIWVISFGKLLAVADAAAMPAGVGAILRVIIENGESIPALVGALLTCAMVFWIARMNSPGASRGGGGSGLDPLTLLLVGVVVSSFNGALVILLNSLKPQGFNADITVYLIGFINDRASNTQILVGLVIFLGGWAVALASAGAMNVASLSDTEATSLGLRLSRLRTLLFIVASIMTAAAIALARAIGFVGLICPHVCRLLFGPDHRQLIVTAPFCGAIFLMLADALVQISKPWIPYSLPVGVVTALCGAPFFLVLLRHYNRQRSTGGGEGEL
ncbi:MAG: iron chelate uptake ABC transporter family permease subunit [Phycisphaerae bacterium]